MVIIAGLEKIPAVRAQESFGHDVLRQPRPERIGGFEHLLQPGFRFGTLTMCLYVVDRDELDQRAFELALQAIGDR